MHPDDTLVRSLEFWILPSCHCSLFNYSLAISVDHSMSHFSSNIPHPLRSSVSRVPSTGQSMVSPYLTVVPTPVVTVNPPPNGAGSLVFAPSHGHNVSENPVTSVEPLEPTPQMDKGKQPVEEGL